MERWQGKTAIVTGAVSGIGKAITYALLRNGVNVVGLDIQEEQIATMKCNISKEKLTGNLHLIHCDVSCDEDVNQAFAWVEENMNGVDIMVNNAGVTAYTRIIESDRKAFERLLNINVLAVAVCTNLAVRSMRKRNVEGHVFNVNSIAGHALPSVVLSNADGFNGWNLYPTTKHGTVALTRSVREELTAVKARIRITSISPGLVKTEIAKGVPQVEDFFRKYAMLDPSDIADGLIYALGRRPAVQITELTIEPTETMRDDVYCGIVRSPQ